MTIVNKLIKYFIFIILLIFSAQLFAQVDQTWDASKLKLAIKKLNVLGSVLYIAAHPDDENTAFLAYASTGELLETGYLSLTRGDGGQNLIGTEQSDLLSILRTKELLEARKIDGTKQFFSRAIDFGYSKNAKETLAVWGKEHILYDVIWTIRKFRPDVIVTRFPGTGEGGHGNHTASAILAKQAFKLAADSTVFPDQLKYVKPWQPKRIMWNAWLPLLQKRNEDTNKLVSIDLGAFNPLLGLSYTEIAALSRSMHKSQGFGASGRRGTSLNYFQNIDGSNPTSTMFDGIDMTWNRLKGGKEISEILDKAYNSFIPEKPYLIIPLLFEAFGKMGKIEDDYWVNVKKEELKEVIKNAAGIWLEANADDYSAVPGEDVKISARIVNRSPFEIKLDKINFPFEKKPTIVNQVLTNGNIKNVDKIITLPTDIDYTQPYWLKKEHTQGLYNVDDKKLIGMPESNSPLNVNFILSFNGLELSFSEPVQFVWTDPVQGEKYRPFEIRPVVSINLDKNVLLFPNDKKKEIKITLKANINNCNGFLNFNLNNGWIITPNELKFNLEKKYDEKVLTFTITPPKISYEAQLLPQAVINGKKYDQQIVSINYNHIPIRTLFPKADLKLVKLNINKVINNIGYVMGPGDLIQNSLETLGYHVKLLNDDEISKSDLSGFDAIIVGIRAYNTRDVLSKSNQQLLNYVKNGGTLLVQYNNNIRLKTKDIGPYPFEISHDRTTEENANINILDASNPILSFPNKITQEDFKDWIQERGLYFADIWDSNYTTPISTHDTDEPELKGGLLYTKFGKGIFIYTGYSFFRQLPAGVPGAFRFFVNLLSAGKAK